MDSDGEDVVFENSPLYEHLKETGYSDFEWSTKTTVSVDSSDGKSTNSWDHLCALVRKLFCALRNSGRKCINAIITIFLQDFQDLGHSTRKEIITFLSNSKLLIEDDRKFLTSFSSEFIENYEHCALSTFTKWKNDIIAFGTPYVIAGSIAFFSWCVASTSPFVTKSNIWNIFDKLLLALVIIVIIGHTTRNFIYYYYKQNSRRSIERLKELVEESINVGVLAKKCIRFIQESEIVARGFTLASLNVPVQRLELSSTSSLTSRQCPELRENIFHWTRNVYYRYRHATLEIYKIIPLQPMLDVLSHYLASIKLDEFGPILKISANSEVEKQELMEASDQFSVSSLKSVLQLMEVQQSEFFRLFTMGFIPGALVEVRQESISALHILSKLIPYVEELIEADQRTHTLLIAAYNYYKSLEVCQMLAEEEKVHHSTKTSPCAAVSLALHSLNLHLRAALKRVQNTELHIEKNVSNISENPLSDLQIDTELKSCLNEVKAELEASKECLNETEQELNLLMNKELPGAPQKIVHPEGSSVEQNDQLMIPLFEIGEPVIEDQVFEAFTDKVETEVTATPLFSDSREKLKEQKEASAHLLKELRSVLVSKALEHKLREEKALSVAKSNVGRSQQDLSASSESEKQKEEGSPMQEETSSDDSPQDNLTDKSIETIRESDEVEKWELLSDKDVETSSNNNEMHLHCSSEKTESIILDSENNITEAPPNANIHHLLDGMSFALGSSIAALAAERCRNRDMPMETFAAEGEECFGDDDDDDDSD